MRRLLILLILASFFATSAHAANKVIINKPSKSQCNMLVKNLEDSLELGNHCNEDADCIPLSLGCPLPCNALVHVTDDIEHWAVLKNNYDKLCGECDSHCSSPPGQAVCVDRKCVYR